MPGFATTTHTIINGFLHDASVPDLVFAGGRLEVRAGSGPSTQIYTLSNGTLRWDSTSSVTATYISTTINGRALYLEEAHLDRLDSALAGSGAAYGRGEVLYSAQSGQAADRANIVALDNGGQTVYVTAIAGQSGLATLTRGTGDTLSILRQTNDTSTSYLNDPYVLASVELGGRNFVFAASQSEAGVSSYELMGDGRLQSRDDLGAEDGLGISLPSAMLVTEIAGEPVLLLASAGSGTITVMGISTSGALTVLDHVTDDRSTRFGGVDVLETITVSGRSYVVAAGNDDGVSLFSLLPGGRLMHLETLIDTTTLGLDNVNGIALSVVGGVLHVFVTSETEAGVTHLTVDTGTIGLTQSGGGGNDTLTGGNNDDLLSGGAGADRIVAGSGNDILMDGAGIDTLVGGNGADVFVLSADGVRDEISGFRLGEDRIDLSAWARLYSVDQLTITTQSDGARVRFGNEEIMLRTVNGVSLAYADFITTDILGLFRPPIVITTPITNNGTAAADQLIGGLGNDRILGGAENDVIDGKDGHDMLDGGTDRDTVFGGAGNDTLIGQGGHDYLSGDGDNDSMTGGTGADTLDGGAGNDTLKGDSSTDLLHGNEGDDSLVGGTGSDTLYGDGGDDAMFGNTGEDTLYGGDGHDEISAGDGIDLVHGEAGNDLIYGRSGWDLLYGDGGNDTLIGSQGVDALYGGTGHDSLSGGSGEDRLFGETGNDTLYGNFGADRMSGGAGADALYGGTGDDTLTGGDGADTILGNQGVDLIDGGAGNDDLRGGTLLDTFIFAVGHDADRISDFEASQDILQLTSALVGGRTTGSAVISEFASVVGAMVVFDFGSGDTITLENLSSLSGLADNIDII